VYYIQHAAAFIGKNVSIQFFLYKLNLNGTSMFKTAFQTPQKFSQRKTTNTKKIVFSFNLDFELGKFEEKKIFIVL
jgi:hypothetical protein